MITYVYRLSLFCPYEFLINAKVKHEMSLMSENISIGFSINIKFQQFGAGLTLPNSCVSNDLDHRNKTEVWSEWRIAKL